MDAQEKPPDPAVRARPPVEPPLRVSVRREKGVPVVALAGTVQLDEYAALQARLLAAIEPGCPDLILDLSELEFMGSPGLTAMLAARNAAAGHGGHVHLAGPRPAIGELLRIARLDRVFSIHDTVADALRATGQPRD